MGDREAAIKEELQQLKERQAFLQKQLEDNMNDLKKEKLKAVQALLESYKNKFSKLNTTISYDELSEGWVMKIPSGKRLFIPNSLHSVKGEVLDEILNKLEIYLPIKDILPDFEIGYMNYDDKYVILHQDKKEVELRALKGEDGQINIRLTKTINDGFYSCDLDDRLSLEVSSNDEYTSIRFMFSFKSDLEDLDVNIANGLVVLDKIPWC